MGGPASQPPLAGLLVVEPPSTGVAHLRGRSISERVRGMVAIAHPDDRAALRRGADRVVGHRRERNP
jgi:acyl-CoA hydrolase